MAKGSPKNVASMNPDDMTQGGLPDDFDGVISKVRFKPYDYDGKSDKAVLVVAMTITPDEDSGLTEFTNYYSAGDLKFFVPSVDGEDSVDLDGDGEDCEGVYALRVGTKEQLNNNTNWAHFITSALDAGLSRDSLSADVRFLEGVSAHWNRIPQKKRAGIVVPEGEEQRVKTILVMTQIHEAKAGKSAGAGKATSGKATASKPATDDDGLSSELSDLIVNALAENNGSITRAKIVPLAMKSFEGSKRAKAVKLGTDVKFLKGSDMWSFDAETGTLTLG